MNRDLVSVVIPVHGRFERVEPTIRSVLDQRGVEIDLVVVDDGSDPPFSPPADLADRFRCVHLPRNCGPGPAREAGRVRARGGFVAYLDSDDRWDPAFARTLRDSLAERPELGMAYCAMRTEGTKRKQPWRTGDTILPRLLWGRPWHTSACLWRRSVVERIGPWRTVWRWEDYVYDNRAGCLDVRVGYLDQPLLHVADDSGVHISKISKTPRQADGFARAVAIMIDDVAASHWVEDATVCVRLARLGLSAAAQAADTASTEGARVALRALPSLLLGRADVVALVAGSGVALAAGRHGDAARLLRRARRALPDPPAPSGGEGDG